MCPVIDEKSTKSPWYLEPRERKYYNLKSLDKKSFVYTRTKKRPDAVISQSNDVQSLITNNTTSDTSNKTRSKRRLPDENEMNSPENDNIPKRVRRSSRSIGKDVETDAPVTEVDIIDIPSTSSAKPVIKPKSSRGRPRKQ